MNYLTPDDIDCFNQEGYLIFEGLLDHDLNERLKADVGQLMVDRQQGDRPILMTYPELGPFTSEPSVVNRVADLMGGQKFTHHHIHASWHLPGEGGAEWHHDYVQTPQTKSGDCMGDKLPSTFSTNC